MQQNRKETAWKKSRKFGDVKGGRMRPKLADNIFNRQHNLLAPTENQELPIFMVDNPSRDFYFPVSVEEIKQFLLKLPKEQTDNITHIWLRKVSKKEYEKDKIQGCFICGSGVQLIVLYPFPTNLKMDFGSRKPTRKELKWYAAYQPELLEKEGKWILKWTKESIKRYYLEGLLLHEMGHQLDSYYQRYWSATYKKQKAESFADNFAYYWGDKIRNEVD